MTLDSRALIDLGDRVVTSRAVPAGADAIIAAGKPPAGGGVAAGGRLTSSVRDLIATSARTTPLGAAISFQWCAPPPKLASVSLRLDVSPLKRCGRANGRQRSNGRWRVAVAGRRLRESATAGQAWRRVSPSRPRRKGTCHERAPATFDYAHVGPRHGRGPRRDGDSLPRRSNAEAGPSRRHPRAAT
jgi:hypothetical protein